MFTMCTAGLNACWDTTVWCHWTMMAWSSLMSSLANRTKFIIFFQKWFNHQWLQFLFTNSFNNWLGVSCFSSWKAFAMSVKKIFDCMRWRHIHVTILQYWAKFSNFLVHWSIRMFHVKKYETTSKFVKVMARILDPLFYGHTYFTILTYTHTVNTNHRLDTSWCWSIYKQ